jgi:hypothetical protein
MEERLIKKLMAKIKCESCGQHYEAYNIDILGHSEDMWFVKVLCATCHSQCLVAAVVRKEKAPAVTTDLTEEELKANNDSTIEVDDILDMHRFLEDFDGDFLRLFS